MNGLRDKVVVCTGAGRRSGLGAAILHRMAAEGCRVVVTDLGQPDALLNSDDIGGVDEMDAVVADIKELGAECIGVACDVRRQDAVRNLFDVTCDAFGRVDILVNNAGVGYLMRGFQDVSLEEWQLVLDVNLTGAFLCAQEAAARMIKAEQGGRIVNIASQAAKSGFPHLAAYVASKHGLVGLTRSNAIELAEHGITVNAVCPNHVTTGLGAKQNAYYSKLRGQTLEEFMAAMRDRIPLGRPGTPADTAAAVAFLASDDAAYITGEALNVSGGEEMH
ncbi:MAG: SDR family NAD(P)-dependent oxidoreductase [Gammaproteobacteria bacterium]|nr:SDR family NAD(P)-dependent oxidoreductase [Gammaproteobacteria bacterium]